MFQRSRQDASNKPNQPSGDEPALGGRDIEITHMPRLGGAAGLLHTLEALTDEDWQVRMRAVEALGQMSGDEVLANLAEALRDSSHHVREHAAEALGRIGGKKAFNILLKALESIEIHNGVAAIGLAYFPRPEVVKRLIAVLDNSYHDDRQQVIDALVRIGGMAAPQLIDALSHAKDTVASGAIEALGRIGGQAEDAEERGRYFDAVAPMIHHKDYRISNAAYLAIGQLRDPRALSLLTRWWSDNQHYNGSAMQALGAMGEMAVPTIVEGLFSEDRTRARNAAEAFRFLGADAVTAFAAQVARLKPAHRRTLLSHMERFNDPGIAALQDLLSGDERDIYLAAADILSTLAAFRWQTPQIGLESVLHHPDPEVRARSASVLASAPWHTSESIDVIVELTHDVDKRVRTAAVRILRNRHQGVHALINALADEHLGVRLEAVHALAGVPCSEGAQALAGILRGPERDLHAAAAQSLRMMHGIEVVSVLTEALDSAYTTSTRRKAARSLAAQRDAWSVAPLLTTIGDRNHNVGVAAARELGKLIRRLDSQEHFIAIDVLRDGLVHPDPIIRLHAAYNLCWLGDAAGATILAAALAGQMPIRYLNTQAIRDALEQAH
jgi:HEAT repeat protein